MDSTARLTFLDCTRIDLRLDDCGCLTGTIEDREHEAVRPRALFPFSLPEDYVELRGDDGDLIGFIRRLGKLSPDTADAVRTSIRLHHFVPLVRRILSIEGRHHMYTWRVVTDRGEIEFHIRGRRQNLEEIGGGEHVVTDTDGNRYRIPNVPDLDARSLLELRKVL